VALIALRGTPAEPKALAVHLADKQNVAVGQYVQAPAEAEVALQFSDGSHIEVVKHSRARLMGLRANGADVSLESGLMHVQVQHRDDTSWQIGAGPYGVHVIGTRFDVRWQPEDDQFELTLHEGKVELSGCAFGAAHRLRAGQTVRASCKNERFQVSTADGAVGPEAGSGSVESFDSTTALPAALPEPTAPTDGADAANTAETSPASATQTPAAKPASGRASAAEQPRASVTAPKQVDEPPMRLRLPPQSKPGDWRALAQAGQHVQALRAARAAGLEQECARATESDLRLLAYASRYARDTDTESYAWRLLRERFHGTKDSSIAAFALGRIEFDNHGAYAKAAEWFRTYLTEQPTGDLAREALGRLLEATQQLGDQPAARELARRYLREYPGGPHASLAQRLTDGDAR
jgi:hypothetical protein